jgi:type I restriction enzyme S subunit
MFIPKSDNAYKVYEQKNAIQKDHTLGSYYISEEKYESLKGFAVQPNDVIVSCAGTIGETYVLPENIQEGIINQALMLIRLYYRDIERFYLLYFDFILKEEAYKESKGTAIKNIPPFDVLKNFYIPIPPIEEQQRILKEVDRWMLLVDSIDSNKEHLESIIKQAKRMILDLAIHGKLVPQDPNDEPALELLKRINPNAEITCDNGQYGKMPEEWIMCTIGDLFDVVSAKRVLKSDWKNKGIPFYRAREIVQLHKEGIADKDLFITEELFAELKDKFGTPNVGDIMLSAVGSIGYTYIVNEKDSFYYKDASVLCLRNVNKLNSQYFSMLFETTFVKEQMHDNSKGTTVDTITIEKLKKYFVPLPPLAEQHRIVTKIEELFSSLDNIQ